MALTHSMAVQMGAQAADWQLPGVVGLSGEVRTFSLAEMEPARALVVIFMCNHCPYVIAVQERLRAAAERWMPQGVAWVGINSNDSKRYPDDSFENMQKRARELRYPFAYLWDETQSVARAYDAVCTPDPYVYERTAQGWSLAYHGRIDDSWRDPATVTERSLELAIEGVLGGRADQIRSLAQIPAMGCSIKWRQS